MLEHKGFLLVVIIGLLAGCGDWKADGPQYLRDTYGSGTSCLKDSANNGKGDVRVTTTPAQSIAGRWAVEVNQHGTIAPTGETWQLYLTGLYLANIPPDGSGVYFTFCDQLMHVTTPPFGPDKKQNPMRPQSHIGQGLKDAMVSTWVPFSKPSLNSLPAINVLWLWGLRNMKDPWHDPLPDKGDSRIWDQDGDGHPGVTIVVTKPLTGDRYMIRRGIWKLAKGTPDKDFLWITGTLKFQIDQKAIGASDQLLMTVAPVTPKNDNTYLMRRVPGNFTCQDLLTHKDSVFANPPGK